MARVLWLADVLRAVGLTVVEHSGWKSRGFQPWEPRHGIVHATAAPRSQSDATQVAIVRDGHSTLQGPIANAVVDRTGRWHVVASGRCNTAKTGWAGPANGLGNTHLLGVEACNDNRSEPWPDAQYQAYARGWAAICKRMGWAAERCVGHKEHQPGDKSDPTFGMAAFRRRVSQLIEGEDVSASQVWQTDGIIPAPELTPKGAPRPRAEIEANPHWWAANYMQAIYELAAQARGEQWSGPLVNQRTGKPAGAGSLIAWTHYAAWEGLEVTRSAGEKLDAILAATAGEAAPQILARLDEHHQAEMARLAELTTLLEAARQEREQIADLVAEVASGERDAAAVVDELARRLAATEPA